MSDHPSLPPTAMPVPFLSTHAQLRLAQLENLAPGLELWPAWSQEPAQGPDPFAPAANTESPSTRHCGTVLERQPQALTLETPAGSRHRLRPATDASTASTPLVLLQPGDRIRWKPSASRAYEPASALHVEVAESFQLLAPNLLPDSPWIGLIRGERRPGGGASLAQLHARAHVLSSLRRFFEAEQFLEVDTPILAAHSGLEPHLDPFETRFRSSVDAQDARPFWLLTSPEYCLKRLVAAGVERVFQVGKVFRNGEVGPNHNPEFTLLEWYRAWADYQHLMLDTERLVMHLLETSADARGASASPWLLFWQGRTVDCRLPWRRLTVREAFLEYAGLELADVHTADALRAAASHLDMHLPADASWDELYFRILITRIEPRLGLDRPTFLMDYPAQFAALSRVRQEPFPVAERFELYIAGVEVANAYSELNDPVKQALRFAAEQEERRQLGAPVFTPDPDYLRMLEAGLPPTAGIALGVDRLIMLLINARNVRETLAFPFPMPE